jgi:hypothetical protein
MAGQEDEGEFGGLAAAMATHQPAPPSQIFMIAADVF